MLSDRKKALRDSDNVLNQLCGLYTRVPPRELPRCPQEAATEEEALYQQALAAEQKHIAEATLEGKVRSRPRHPGGEPGEVAMRRKRPLLDTSAEWKPH